MGPVAVFIRVLELVERRVLGVEKLAVLIQQLFPGAEAVGSVVVIAVGLSFLVIWSIDRWTGSL
jgi:hypothetical protein